MKQVYEKPLTELYEMEFEGALLNGSAERMKAVNGSWDDEEDW